MKLNIFKGSNNIKHFWKGDKLTPSYFWAQALISDIELGLVSGCKFEEIISASKLTQFLVLSSPIGAQCTWLYQCTCKKEKAEDHDAGVSEVQEGRSSSLYVQFSKEVVNTVDS